MYMCMLCVYCLLASRIHAEEIKDELITMYRQLSEKDEAVLIFKKKIEKLISQAAGQTPSQSKHNK